jgi:hypothetical protein
MSGSTITTTITNAVVLGTPGYATPLTITNAGAIEPVTPGAIGIYGPAGISGLAFSNAGIIDGDLGTTGAASGSLGGTGGDAVYLHTGTAENTGLITAGAGGGGGGGARAVPAVSAFFSPALRPAWTMAAQLPAAPVALAAITPAISTAEMAASGV